MVTKQVEITLLKHDYAFVSGFSGRISALLTMLSYPNHGRITHIANWTGLSVGGARLLITKDRPPKSKKALDGLIHSLALKINQQFCTTISEEDLRDHLLYGKKSPIQNSSSDPAIRQYENISSVYLIKIYVLIDRIAKDNDIIILKDLGGAQLELLYNKAIEHCAAQNVNIDSADLSDVIDLINSLLNLATKNLL